MTSSPTLPEPRSGRAYWASMPESPVFFTPSYIGDLERMVWMRRSLEHFFDGQVKHVVAVPRGDKPSFKRALGASDIELICQEDLVDVRYFPNLLYKIIANMAPRQKWRFASCAGKPGWIIQQIAKLSSYRLSGGGPIIFLDSDIFFYRRFNLSSLEIDQSQRTLVRILPKEEGAKHPHHLIHSRQLLGLPPGPTDTTYMGYPAIWYGDWLTQLLDHIESLTGKPWQIALLEVSFNISEYTIYGVYVDEILKPSGLNIRSEPFNLIAWDVDSFKSLKERVCSGQPLPAGRLSLTIQSNIKIPVAEYADMLQRLME